MVQRFGFFVCYGGVALADWVIFTPSSMPE
jgi:hypothetical protein